MSLTRLDCLQKLFGASDLLRFGDCVVIAVQYQHKHCCLVCQHVQQAKSIISPRVQDKAQHHSCYPVWKSISRDCLKRRQAQAEAVTVPFSEQAEQRPEHFHVCISREICQPNQPVYHSSRQCCPIRQHPAAATARPVTSPVSCPVSSPVTWAVTTACQQATAGPLRATVCCGGR